MRFGREFHRLNSHSRNEFLRVSLAIGDYYDLFNINVSKNAQDAMLYSFSD